MIGIRDIAGYIPPGRIHNLSRQEEFQLQDGFLEKKIGFLSLSRRAAGEEASDMCCAAFERLAQNKDIHPASVQIIVVCTQNPDYGLPHTAAVVHGKLGFPADCAAFDISLGCSGYGYSLAVIENMMHAMGYASGLLFTADPYSKIIDNKDHNTALLFGDAASVTLIGTDPIFTTGRFTFGTQGKQHSSLICRDGVLHMNGRAVFNFTASIVPQNILDTLELNELSIEDIDRFLLHQGSKYILDFIRDRLRIPHEKAPFLSQDYGNTVSSSIPLLLESCLHDASCRRILISGFGVGLSWSSTVLFRRC